MFFLEQGLLTDGSATSDTAATAALHCPYGCTSPGMAKRCRSRRLWLPASAHSVHPTRQCCSTIRASRGRADKNVDLLDYARSHKSRLSGAQALDLSDAMGQIVPVDASDLGGDSLSSAHVLEALDKARIDRNYESPAYLREDLADFPRAAMTAACSDCGRPAHVGKTTFVQGSLTGWRSGMRRSIRTLRTSAAASLWPITAAGYRTGLSRP